MRFSYAHLLLSCLTASALTLALAERRERPVPIYTPCTDTRTAFTVKCPPGDDRAVLALVSDTSSTRGDTGTRIVARFTGQWVDAVHLNRLTSPVLDWAELP